eukprot:1047272-Amphidinium_carterae.1
MLYSSCSSRAWSSSAGRGTLRPAWMGRARSSTFRIATGVVCIPMKPQYNCSMKDYISSPDWYVQIISKWM